MANSIIGKEVDGYRIQEILGRGGMGVVYRATDVGLSRDVALKRIAPSMANDESFLRRFRSEAQALARIDSPYIVSVHALRQTEIGLLLVMECVEGGTLKDLIEEGPMDWQEALPIIKQMLIALEHAHGADVIHRDIKPHNVMLSTEGTVKVTDFGLAKVHRSDTRATVTQGVHGTLNYMSPEQVQGSADLDHRSDLFSLGMTVYEMLAGELPFDEDSGEFMKMRMIVEEELPRLREQHPAVPDEVSALVMRALEKDPDDRFQTAKEMREAFEAFEQKRGVGAPSQGSVSRGDTTREEVSPDEASRDDSGRDDDSQERGRPAPSGRPWSSDRWHLPAGLAALALLAVAGGYWLFAGTPLFGEWGLVAGGGSSGPPTTLSVSTEPVGATVLLDGNEIGPAPLDTALKGGTVRVQVQRAGYVPVDTLAELGGQQKVDLRFPLIPEVTPLSVQSTPAGQVSLDGREVGQTPINRDLRTDTIQIRVEREGYFPVDTLLALAQVDQAQLDLQLEERPTPSSPSYGALTLDASPSGTVYVDGERHSAGQSFPVTAGESHRIRIVHPQNGACETTVRVGEGETEALTCYFEHQVTIASEPWASVFVNGESTEEETPYNTMLGTGRTYEIEARIDTRSYTVTGGTHHRRDAETDNIISDPQSFSGRSTTVRLQPSFRQERHIFQFNTSGSGP